MPLQPLRPLTRLYPPPPLHWVGDGFRVRGYLQAYADLAEAMDPFLLLDYHPPYTYAPTQYRRGVGTHPHRGFETVTLAFAGSVSHHDSAGGGGTIGPGDVQWMSAASGVLHQEYHAAEFARTGGTFQMAQLWVNLPARHKMGPPSYHAITAAELGHVALPEEGGHVRVLAGEFQGVRGPARPFSPIAIQDVTLAAGRQVRLELPETFNVGLLVMAGPVTLNGHRAATDDFASFRPGAGGIEVVAEATARLLVLAGEPLGEPVVAHGPFVMSSVAEIEQAIEDFNSGRFGRLEG
ncbi:MAG: pirin family protein [Candidatus Sericytochromatia bacterium]|nr:pirin family protein [Candidatus Sericytochromatia bacterium]